jgi:hypothetical protein
MPKDRIAVPMLVRSDGEFRKNNLEIRHKYFKGESQLHWHDYYELEYIKSGSITYQYNGNSYTLSAGSAYLVTPSDYHNIIAYEAELYNIAFNEPLATLPNGIDFAFFKNQIALDLFNKGYHVVMIFLFAFFAYDSAKMQLERTK